MYTDHITTALATEVFETFVANFTLRKNVTLDFQTAVTHQVNVT